MSVSRRYFPGVSQETLEKWLGWVNLEIATGKVRDSLNAEEVGMHNWIDPSLPPLKRQELILNDLSILDPDGYPPEETAPIRRTVPRYI